MFEHIKRSALLRTHQDGITQDQSDDANDSIRPNGVGLFRSLPTCKGNALICAWLRCSSGMFHINTQVVRCVSRGRRTIMWSRQPTTTGPYCHVHNQCTVVMEDVNIFMISTTRCGEPASIDKETTVECAKITLSTFSVTVFL